MSGRRRAARATLRPLLTLCLPLAALAGCAIGDGGFLLEILPDTMSARLASSAGRFDEEGWLATAEGYALRLDRIELEPEGLTLLGGGGRRPAPLVTLGIAAPLPVATRLLTTPIGGVPLGPCIPGCGLEGTTLGGAQLPLRRLRAEGQVRDPSLRRLAQPTPLHIDLGLAADVTLAAPLDLVLDRRAPERLALRALVEVAVELGDGVAWAALPRDGARLCLGDGPPCQGEEAAARLRRNLAASLLSVDLSEPTE